MQEHPQGAPAGSTATVEHNLNEVWTVVRRQSESIAEIRQGQTSHGTALQDIRQELRAIREIATRQPQPTNWTAIATLCLGILIAGGGYASSVIHPVKEDVSQAIKWQTARSESLIADYRDFGVIGYEAKDAHQLAKGNGELLDNLREQIAYQRGLLEATRQQVQNVDIHRTRGENVNPVQVEE
jgi:hypothetical protein